MRTSTGSAPPGSERRPRRRERECGRAASWAASSRATRARSMRHRRDDSLDLVMSTRNQDDPDMTSAPNPQAGTVLSAGTPAPDFELQATPDETLKLTELRGRPVILAFYPADWSPVCGDQLALYNELIEEFDAYGAQLLGISVDGAWCHAAFTK